MGQLAGWLDDVRQNGANGPTPGQIKAHRVLAATEDAAAGAAFGERPPADTDATLAPPRASRRASSVGADGAVVQDLVLRRNSSDDRGALFQPAQTVYGDVYLRQNDLRQLDRPEASGDTSTQVRGIRKSLRASPPQEAQAAPKKARRLKLGENAAFFGQPLTQYGSQSDIGAAGVAATIQREVGKGNQAWTTAASAGQGPAGPGQFDSDTWTKLATTDGTQLNLALKARGVITAKNQVAKGSTRTLLLLRNDREMAVMGIADRAQHNLQLLDRNGLAPPDASAAEKEKLTYIMHHEGTTKGYQLISGARVNYSAGDLYRQVGRKQGDYYLNLNGRDASRAYMDWLFNLTDRVNAEMFQQDGDPSKVRSVRQLIPSLAGDPLADAAKHPPYVQSPAPQRRPKAKPPMGKVRK